MTIRTTKKTVSFRRSYVLGGFDEELPAGDYIVETDEELLEGISFPAYRRVLTLIHLPAKPGQPGVKRTWTIDPNELDAAVMRDRALAETPARRDDDEMILKGTAKSPQEKADRQAIERGEDEGMSVHSR